MHFLVTSSCELPCKYLHNLLPITPQLTTVVFQDTKSVPLASMLLNPLKYLSDKKGKKEVARLVRDTFHLSGV